MSKIIQFSVTTLGEIQVPDNYSDEQVKEAILEIYIYNEPNEVEWEELNA